MQEQKDIKDWKENSYAEVFSGQALVSWHKWDVHLPLVFSSRRPEAQPLGANMLFLLAKIQIARNCGAFSIRPQSLCTPNLPPYSEFRHLQSPSDFRGHASVPFSNIQVQRKPLLSTRNPDSIRKLRHFLILYLSSLVHCFLCLCSYIPVSKIFLFPVAMVKAYLKRRNCSSEIHWPTKYSEHSWSVQSSAFKVTGRKSVVGKGDGQSTGTTYMDLDLVRTPAYQQNCCFC